jgi:hypothetical protein
MITKFYSKEADNVINQWKPGRTWKRIRTARSEEDFNSAAVVIEHCQPLLTLRLMISQSYLTSNCAYGMCF